MVVCFQCRALGLNFMPKHGFMRHRCLWPPACANGANQPVDFVQAIQRQGRLSKFMRDRLVGPATLRHVLGELLRSSPQIIPLPAFAGGLRRFSSRKSPARQIQGRQNHLAACASLTAGVAPISQPRKFWRTAAPIGPA